MNNPYTLDGCSVNIVLTPSGDDSYALMNGTSLSVALNLDTPVETDKDANKIKLPVIRFIPINTVTNEYYPFYIDVTNAPVYADFMDGFKFIYTLCESTDPARAEPEYYDRVHFTYGAYIVFNPHDHTDYIICLTDGAPDITNEQLHNCEPWPVPDQNNGGGGGGVEGN